MRYIFIIFFLTFGISAFAQQNIVESLQRNRAGEGAVTIHQDPKITGLIGTIHTGSAAGGEQKTLKARGYRVCRKQFSCGSQRSQQYGQYGKRGISGTPRLCLFPASPLVMPCR